MSRTLTRRHLLASLGAVAAVTGPVRAGAMESSLRPLARPEDLRRQLGAEGVISRFGLSGVVACAVADVKSGLELEAVRGDMPLPPASVAKALTAVYAMDALGADYRFQTRLLASAPIRGGILEGDLILRGGGDPTLDTDDLATLAAGLKEAGLRELRGQFIVDDSFLPFARTIDAGQLDHVGYSPSVSGIALNFNRVHFEWKRSGGSYAVTMDARTARYRPDVSMARMRVAQRSLPVYTYADKGDFDDWSVARGALGNGGARWLPVRKPALYAGDVFRTMARAQGLVLPKTTVREGKAAGLQTLVIHNSAPLPVILRGMLKYSTNLTAEMVGMTASVARGTPPGSLRGSAQVMSRWAATELGMTGTSMVDHSGLGSTSQMTANDLTRALVRIGQRGILRPLLKPFVLRGANGREVNPSTLRVDAKTGTLNYVSGLGGFITASDGTDMAFAIFTANPEVRKTIRREDSERPQGARGWNSRSRRLQSRLIERWGQIYGS